MRRDIAYVLYDDTLEGIKCEIIKTKNHWIAIYKCGSDLNKIPYFFCGQRYDEVYCDAELLTLPSGRFMIENHIAPSICVKHGKFYYI